MGSGLKVSFSSDFDHPWVERKFPFLLSTSYHSVKQIRDSITFYWRESLEESRRHSTHWLQALPSSPCFLRLSNLKGEGGSVSVPPPIPRKLESCGGQENLPYTCWLLKIQTQICTTSKIIKQVLDHAFVNQNWRNIWNASDKRFVQLQSETLNSIITTVSYFS